MDAIQRITYSSSSSSSSASASLTSFSSSARSFFPSFSTSPTVNYFDLVDGNVALPTLPADTFKNNL